MSLLGPLFRLLVGAQQHMKKCRPISSWVAGFVRPVKRRGTGRGNETQRPFGRGLLGPPGPKPQLPEDQHNM